jgi:hypothetical protein
VDSFILVSKYKFKILRAETVVMVGSAVVQILVIGGGGRRSDFSFDFQMKLSSSVYSGQICVFY